MGSQSWGEIGILKVHLRHNVYCCSHFTILTFSSAILCSLFVSGGKDWLIVEDVRDMAGLGSRVLESYIWLWICKAYGLCSVHTLASKG